MRERFNIRKSLYLEITALLMASILCSIVFYFAAYFVSDKVIDSYARRTDYNRRKSPVYARRLQNYVTNNELTYAQMQQLEGWLKGNPEAVLHVYDGNYLVFDSVNDMLEDQAYQREYDEAAAWENFFVLNFADKTVDICLYGNFDYSLYTTASQVCILMSVGLFMVLLASGIGYKTNYIVTLREEIALLEGGALNYPITIKGKDELADLARGLDNMRLSFLAHIEEAESVSSTNQKMITQISHDLRTPLTAITLYSEILQNNKELTEAQRQDLQEKILRKVSHMRDLSDKMLGYSAKTKMPQKAETEWLTPKEAFYDELSELTAYLHQQGFDVEATLDWDCEPLCINAEYISRIFNNISSNALRYAEKKDPIVVESGTEEEFFYLSFANKVLKETPKERGSGIGLHSIETMLQELGGKCELKKADGRFEIKMFFRTDKEESII